MYSVNLFFSYSFYTFCLVFYAYNLLRLVCYSIKRRLFCSPTDERLGSTGYELRGWRRLADDWIEDIDFIFDEGSWYEEGFVDEDGMFVDEGGFDNDGNGLVLAGFGVCIMLYYCVAFV